jgi:hypothetical protein
MTPKLTRKNPNFDRTVRKMLKAGGNREVAVGFPKGAATTGAKPYGTKDATVLDIAIWNNFGAVVKPVKAKALRIPNGAGFVFAKRAVIPARPFMQQSVGPVNRKAAAICKKVAKGVQKRGKGLEPEDMDKLFAALGQMGVATVRSTITSGTFVPNSPITIANKGSSHPLMNLGILRKSVSYLVREKR